MFVVTGATGRTGRAVVAGLLRAGRAVRAVSRRPVELEGVESVIAQPDDPAALTAAFAGAEGAYVMVQPNYIPDSPDFPAHQHAVVDAMAAALAAAGTGRIVTLSSWGADKPGGTGPVAGLHYLETRIDALDAVVTHLRAGYFMENLLGHADTIRDRGVIAAPFDPDIAMPFIAAADIGHAAARILLGPPAAEILELHGERDLSMAEATRVIGGLSGRPDLRYVRQSLDEFAAGLRDAGVSASVAGLMVEVAEAINSGHTAAVQPRSARTTTPTSIEEFVTDALISGTLPSAASR
ncbi:epimerase [Pseudonocardiaceae bacterium YIM PH 21723]|nr:epimerase [Pseudonocardiaceae bacterium YIM PH 21723]